MVTVMAGADKNNVQPNILYETTVIPPLTDPEVISQTKWSLNRDAITWKR